MSKVYIVQESGSKNFMPAREFGELHVILTNRGIDMKDIDQCINELRKCLANFTEHDFLLLVGDPILMGIATAIVAEITDNLFTVLWWDRVKYTYHPILIRYKL